MQADGYVTPPQPQDFPAHHDVHDVVVLQLAERKHWRVHEPIHVDPLQSQPWVQHGDAVAARTRDDEPVIDRVLEPGDAMYLPRGWLHSATALGDVSAHLTIGVHVVTRYALAELILKLIASDERLRTGLLLGLDLVDPEQLAPLLDGVRAALTDAVAAVPAEGERHDTGVTLVCPHGRHDACCAVTRYPPRASPTPPTAPGNAATSAATASPPPWCSPTASPMALRPVRGAHDRLPPRAGLVDHGKLRGRSSLPPALQVSQHHALLATGATVLDDLRVGEVTSDGAPAGRSRSPAPECGCRCGNGPFRSTGP